MPNEGAEVEQNLEVEHDHSDVVLNVPASTFDSYSGPIGPNRIPADSLARGPPMGQNEADSSASYSPFSTSKSKQLFFLEFDGAHR